MCCLVYARQALAYTGRRSAASLPRMTGAPPCSIDGTQVPNWLIVLGAVAVAAIVYQMVPR